MAMLQTSDSEFIPVIVSSSFCLILIAFRCGYRGFYRCKWHTSCFRTWHREDLLMAFSLVPLAARAACISMYVELGSRASANATSSAAASGLQNDEIVAKKLVIPARIFYALFLWCMKLCLLYFYSRISTGIPSFERAAYILRICLAVTFVVILFPTLLECRPMSLYWNNLPEGDQCRQARANLITMGVFNIITDLALIIFPIPMVWKSAMDPKKRLRLSILFSFGLVVVIITITRLPLTLHGSVPQRIRSLWADIEIACACLVANASFFYPLAKEIKNGHPLTPDGGHKRDPSVQQWEVSRQPSCPVVGYAEDDLKLCPFGIETQEAVGRNGGKSEKGWEDGCEVQDINGIWVSQIEKLPQKYILDTAAASNPRRFSGYDADKCA